MRSKLRIGTVACALSLMIGVTARGQEAPTLDPKCDEILKKMSQTLAAAKSFSFDSHSISDQLMTDGRKIQFAKNEKVKLRRPDKLAADLVGDQQEMQFRYDGKQVVLYNPQNKSWGADPAPGKIGDTLDMLAEKYGMTIPLADFAFPDPYKSLTENVRSSEYIGIGYVFDTKCHHLSFRQASVDWQIWIEVGEKPLPRKVVITYKESPSHPVYTAFLSNWNLSPDLPDATFTFTPPPDAKKVEFAPSTQPASGK
ncbi:MAG TPA: DUF2092 domain-containing protein [Tepidisphaeraceae bacterium]|jgi:hypothetical protein|nr:DUF2092 domain-containing protein [Tepidisphaeraceae bacterium]